MGFSSYMQCRAKDQCLPSIDAMEFCGEHLLVCGSDCAYNGPALVQLWDLGSPNSCVSFPAHDSVCCKKNPFLIYVLSVCTDMPYSYMYLVHNFTENKFSLQHHYNRWYMLFFSTLIVWILSLDCDFLLMDRCWRRNYWFIWHPKLWCYWLSFRWIWLWGSCVWVGGCLFVIYCFNFIRSINWLLFVP